MFSRKCINLIAPISHKVVYQEILRSLWDFAQRRRRENKIYETISLVNTLYIGSTVKGMASTSCFVTGQGSGPKKVEEIGLLPNPGAQHTRPSLLLHPSSQFANSEAYSEAHKSLEDAENLANLQIQSKSKVAHSNIICDRIWAILSVNWIIQIMQLSSPSSLPQR